MDKKTIKSEFMKKAGIVSAFLYEVKTMEDAFLQVIDLCEKKRPCIKLYNSENKNKTPIPTEHWADHESGCKPAQESDETLFPVKTIAAPDLSIEDFAAFQSLCSNRNIDLVRTGLRKYPGGIDVGFTIADFGIADTGTLVISSDNEDTRLATMLSEFHVVLLYESKIRTTALDMVKELNKLIKRSSSYTAFITGASRTADIERVLAIGVHGPIELHIILFCEK